MVSVLLTRTVALACLSLALSGCLGDSRPPIEAFSTAEPRAFSAEVTTLDGRTSGYVNLSGPVQIANRAGVLVDAYLYEAAWERENGYGYRQYYLDGDLRRIATVFGCGFVVFDCESWRVWHWEGEGRLAPDGLGYPNHIANGGLTSKAVGTETPIPWSAEVDAEGRLVLQVDPRWGQEEPSAYRYLKGRLLPDGPTFDVEKYEDKGPLPTIDTQSLPRSPLPPRPWEGLMFPGEHDDHFDIGVSHHGIATHAFPDLADNNATCVESYELQPSREPKPSDSVLPVPVPSNGQEITAWARVRAVSGVDMTEVEVTVMRNELNGSISMSRTPSATGPASLSCHEMYRSPWPQTPVEKALSVASEVADGVDLTVFTHDVGFMARYANQTADVGLHNYQFDFLPPASGGTGLGNMLQVRFESSGPLLTLKATVRENATFER